MLKVPISRLFTVSPQFTNSFRNAVNADSKFDRILSHVYRKTWTKKQLIEYIKDNVVFESENYIATSLPQGVALRKKSEWADSVTPLLCEADLKEILVELPDIFNTESIYLTVYPRRNASGLTIFSKNYNAKRYLRSNMTLSASHKEYNLGFLAVVLGCPDQCFTQMFGVQPYKIGEKYATSILMNWKNVKDIRKVCYRHEVLESSNLASLVKVEVSQDVRDCVRHILGTGCFTPVLGDIWNCLKMSSTIQGTPVRFDPVFLDTSSLTLDAELLAKLNLEPGEENLIPIHVHFHSLRVRFKNRNELYVSVPPPESFVWTCNQLGFREIKKYVKLV